MRQSFHFLWYQEACYILKFQINAANWANPNVIFLNKQTNVKFSYTDSLAILLLQQQNDRFLVMFLW